MRRVYNAEKSFNSLPQQHQELIPHFLDNLKTIQTCISHNYEIVRLIIRDAEYIFENKTHEADDKVWIERERERETEKYTYYILS